MQSAQFIPLYDYSAFETAVQAFFTDAAQTGGLFISPPANGTPGAENWVPDSGLIPFMTPSQAVIFQKPRPRVSLSPVSYSPLGGSRPSLVLDANNRPQVNAWTVPLEFNIISRVDVAYHYQLRATVLAYAMAMRPVNDQTQISSTGLNSYLANFDLLTLWDLGNSLNVGIGGAADGGYLISSLKLNATFAVRQTSWPGGTVTT